jgi:hypothetical protein
MRLLVLVLLLALPLGAVAQTNPGRRVDAPFRFTPPDDRPSGLDAQKALGYREGLRNQLRVEEQRDIGRSATGAERLQETRRELDRMNRVLENEPAPSRALPGPAETAPQAALPPPVSGGSRHQPTPAEIEQRSADRSAAEPAKPALRPVYDLFGNRLQ